MLQDHNPCRRFRNLDSKKWGRVDKTCFVADKTYSYCKMAAVKSVKLQTEWADSVVGALNWETCFVKRLLGMCSVSELGMGKNLSGERLGLCLRIKAALVALAHREVFQTKGARFASLWIQLKRPVDARN